MKVTSENYVALATRTESVIDSLPTKDPQKLFRLLHGAMGLCTEAGEFQDALKKALFYKQPLDLTNLGEELGDVLWYCGILCDALGLSMNSVLQKNIAKLEKRYPEKFSPERALERDLEGERSILEAEAVPYHRRGTQFEWLQTYTGRPYWFLDPKPEDITIGDIAQALANKCRFSGHTQEFYSVAQHSVLVAEQVANDLPEEEATIIKLWALMHDAPEAYLNDIPRPILKSTKIGAEMEMLTTKCLSAISENFKIPLPIPDAVWEADDRMLVTERDQLMLDSPLEWGLKAEPYKIRIIPWSPQDARHAFLTIFWVYYNRWMGQKPKMRVAALKDVMEAIKRSDERMDEMFEVSQEDFDRPIKL